MERSLLSLSLAIVLVLPVAWNYPLGKNVFASQNGEESEFRDKAFDEEIRKVTWVGDKPVHALESYDNPPDIDNAAREKDNFPSNIFSKFDNTQKKVKDWFDTPPLIDTIKESDKYGNEGDQFYFITRPLVKLTETVSNTINKAIAAPTQIYRSAKKIVSDKLNDVGAGLVGLRR
ncbi:AAEL010113-PA [Aedes aegypti]|uniref:AAEL010113-PA n=1 Tax=Aedes aegypti TaxID=7159 RepID=Q16TV7_AEDAE|nr:AAEL010113-PA [Aedes aegypti]